MKDFVQIARFTYQHEIVVLKHLLEVEHVPFFFLNETLVSTLPFYSNALGGIILFVHQNEMKKATKIIEQLTTTLKIV